MIKARFRGLIRPTDTLPLTVACVFFLQTLDGSILNTSLPQVARSFTVSEVDLNAGLTSYFIASAALAPLSSWFTKRFGDRRTLNGALFIFILASVCCAASQTLTQFVIARVWQGAGAALMAPVGRIAVLRSTSKGDMLRAISVLTWPALLAPVAGPWLGGVLTTWIGWKANFLVNVPFGLVCILLVKRIIPQNALQPDARLDILGAVLISSSLGLSMYALDWLTRGSREALIGGTGLLAIGLLLGGCAFRWLKRADAPLLDLGILSVRTFTVSTLGAGNLIKVAIAATPYLLPLLVQIVWGMSPIRAGMVMMVYFLGNLAMKTVTTPLIRRLGFRAALIGSGASVSVATAILPMMDWSHPGVVNAVVLLVVGASRSLFFTASNTLSFSEIPPQLTASASAFASMMQQVSMALGIALAALGLVLFKTGGTSAGLSRENFITAFTVCAMIAAVGVVWLMRLSRDAGEDVRGTR